MTRKNQAHHELAPVSTRHILLVGAAGSGKTTILRRLVEESPTATEVSIVDVIAPRLRDALTRPEGGLIAIDDAALMNAFVASTLAEVIDGGHIRGTIVLAADSEAVLPASVVAEHFMVVQVEDLVGRRIVRDPTVLGGWKEGTTTEALAALVAMAREKEAPTGLDTRIDEVVSRYVIAEDHVVDEAPEDAAIRLEREAEGEEYWRRAVLTPEEDASEQAWAEAWEQAWATGSLADRDGADGHHCACGGGPCKRLRAAQKARATETAGGDW